MAAVEFLGVIHIIQVDVPPIAHHPFPRSNVEIARDLEEVSAIPSAETTNGVAGICIVVILLLLLFCRCSIVVRALEEGSALYHRVS